MTEQHWTIDSLHTHLISIIENNDEKYEQRFIASKESVNTALMSAQQAVSKAETAAEKRFDAVNEFRATLADQQRTLMPRAEAELMFESINERILLLTESRSRQLGSIDGWGRAIAVAGALIAAYALTRG
jgi:hypothetical protein